MDPGIEFRTKGDWVYATNIVSTVTWLAGQPDYLADLRHIAADLDLSAPGLGRSARVFEWLAAALSYQGISDAVARSYMEDHERPRWANIADGIKTGSCPLLSSYWQFHSCGYRKGARTCAKPHLIDACPLPRHDFRNGNLNQLAYSLLLFTRDVAGGDLVAWIDARLAEAYSGPRQGRLSRMGQALITPLLGLHGASHKVLNMALADLLMIGKARNPLWGEVGVSLVAIDTLVHNFLARTGILKRARAEHPYGSQCYGPRGCAAILSAVSDGIDARQFNVGFPRTFPRYIQHAIWTYCSGEGFNVCNGNRVEDDLRCRNTECRLFATCDRIRLGRKPPKASIL
jgi:hypothetical protein